ncbi:MAG: histidine kinase [Candidatus Dormiibacterota bacterium]
MRRPRLTLPLNPRRRLRDRLLAAMLVVALVPATAFFVLTVVDLNGITQATVNAADSSIVGQRQATLQTQLNAYAQKTIEAPLRLLDTQMRGLAGALSAYLSTNPPAPAAVPNDEIEGQTDGVWQVSPGSGSAGAEAELLVGTQAKSSSGTVAQWAAPLYRLDQQLTKLSTIHDKVGSLSVDAVWVRDTANNAVLVSPPPTSLVGSDLAANPQGAPPDLLPNVEAAGAPYSGGGTADWTTPYENPLYGSSWETTVYVTAGDGMVVGADVPLPQFSLLIGSAPPQPNSYPLLLTGAPQKPGLVIAAGAVGRDFTSTPRLGSPLPEIAGSGGQSLLTALEEAAQPGGSAPPVAATVRGTSKLFFVAGVIDPGWVLVDASPKSDFEPSGEILALQKGINTALSDIFRGAIPIVLILIVVCFLLATVLSRFVVAPVRALTTSAERLAQGRTDEAVPQQGRDEVGDLAASLERMRREINASREVILAASRELEQKVQLRTAELSARNEELLALNELAGSLTRSLDPEAILSGALEAVRAVLPISAGRGFLVNREAQLTARGPAADDRGPLLEEVAFAAYSENLLITRPDDAGTLIGLPLSTGGGALGALGLRSATLPGAEMTTLLVAIGNQVGLALRTARLSQEGREMAVLEERARLAREIHDTLAQQLTGIVIQLEAAQALAGRDPERSLPALSSAQELARSALAEARRSVWDLRPTPLTSTGLVAAAETEVERFRRRTGITARLRAERMAPPPALRPQAEVALLRITQQALANIAAHSGASRVSVRLRHADGHVELTVKDNGHGFDTTALPSDRFGLVGMSERVRLAGGSFAVESATGRGTTISVRLPVVEEARPQPDDSGGTPAVAV